MDPTLDRSFSGPAQLAGMALQAVTGATGLPHHLLVAFPTEPGLPAAWAGATDRLTVLYDDYAVYREDRRTDPPAGHPTTDGPHLTFGWPPPDGPNTDNDTAPDLAVLFLPKGNDAIAAAFRAVARLTPPGARVMVVGAKKSGIASSRPLARQLLGPEAGSRSARHAKLYAYRRPAAPETPGAPDEPTQTYAAEAWGHPLQVVSLPGVFSHGRLDDGTRTLLEHLAPADLGTPATGLDFGCGAGVLTAALRAALPAARIDAVDRQAQSLAATHLTLSANDLDAPTRGRVFPSDVFSDVPAAYDLILSNPPFHSGHDTDFSMTHRLITESPHHLTPQGRLILVTNTFIDYLTPLRQTFQKVEVLHEDGRYRVTRSTKPKT